jgi:hypothetical protein
VSGAARIAKHVRLGAFPVANGLSAVLVVTFALTFRATQASREFVPAP